MNKAAVVKIGSGLIRRKLMREIRSKPGMPGREGADGRPMSLNITCAGRDAIGIDKAAETNQPVSSKSRDVKRAGRHLAGDTPRPGSKQALVIEMLSKEQGTPLDALVKATAWLPHTTRAALTGLRKRGFTVERTRHETKGLLYRITGRPASVWV